MALDSTQLATFAAVVDEGSFEAAARVLHVTPSAVSQRVKALEQAVGQVVLRRAKPCRATPAGRPLLRLAGQIAVLEREALAAAAHRDGQWSRAAVVVNADSLATWFLPALVTAGDRILFDVREDDQDHTTELLRDGAVMAAVTAQREAVQGCRAERLGAMRYLAVAAPRVAARWFPAGGTPAEFAAAPMLVLDRKDRLQHKFLRSLTPRPPEPPTHYIPSAWGFTEAIRLGVGWGLMPEQLADADLHNGRVTRLAAAHQLDVPLYWQHWKLTSTVLSALTTAVRAAAASALR
ncbi:transcriptional regulator ArgP [Asanoa ishikariensis]|uniref:HTH-type transcriptional regulator LysG n=1 Tax=Asanoa ishikariensis TaxID=137265 RepID=A0A1H3QZQ8_9ACTN|nr:LysR family transcriptional regulator ArgP [Asanoa ishikariensis]GIF64535.1 transcriptional regulator ArgP [Asanoa ishikariensis]SDZ19072.1 transcriptional regulator, LysR family [Asanoa ishikariensis]